MAGGSILNDLDDVTSLAPADGQVLGFSTVAGGWEPTHLFANQAVLEGISASGSGQVMTAAERSKLTGIEILAKDDQIASSVPFQDNTGFLSFTNVQDALDGIAVLINSVAGALVWKGAWTASTNTPTISDASGEAGWYYLCQAGGTADLGAGNTVYEAGDRLIWYAGAWTRFDQYDKVSSVAGKIGIVNLELSDNLDVDMAGIIAQDDVLSYVVATGKWVPKAYQTVATDLAASISAVAVADAAAISATAIANAAAISATAVADAAAISAAAIATATAIAETATGSDGLDGADGATGATGATGPAGGDTPSDVTLIDKDQVANLQGTTVDQIVVLNITTGTNDPIIQLPSAPTVGQTVDVLTVDTQTSFLVESGTRTFSTTVNQINPGTVSAAVAYGAGAGAATLVGPLMDHGALQFKFVGNTFLEWAITQVFRPG
jgi:hypothetical protein